MDYDKRRELEKEIERAKKTAKRLLRARLAMKLIMYIALCGIALEAIMYVHEHGLQHLLHLIWYGPKGG